MIKKILYTLIPACMTLSVATAGPLSPSLMSLSPDQMDQTTAGLSDYVVAGVTGGNSGGSGRQQTVAVAATIVAPTADISAPSVYSSQHNTYLVTMVSTGLGVNVAPGAIAGSGFIASTRVVNIEPTLQATGGGNSALSGVVASIQPQASVIRPGTVTATTVAPTTDISDPNVYSQQYITNLLGRPGQISVSPVIAASVPTVRPF